MRMLNPPPPQPPDPPPSHLSTTFALWRRLNPAREENAWLTALLLVTFDHDQGPVVEAVHPEHTLTTAQQEAICFHALPDSAAGGHGREDAMYSFRIGDEQQLVLAHVLFRQAPDVTHPRGAFQKALVVVSSLPCLQFHALLLNKLAAGAFVRGGSVLEQAVKDVGQWPSLGKVDGVKRVTLPWADEEVEVELPESFLRSFAAPKVVQVDKMDNGSPRGVAEGLMQNGLVKRHTAMLDGDVVRKWPLVSASADCNVALFHEVDLAVALKGVREKVGLLWELMALGEPILVVGNTPTQCAAAVLALVGLIHPLPFVGDWRPYLCLQDALCAQLMGEGGDVCAGGGVFGVTNLLLVSTVKVANRVVLGGGKVGVETAHKASLHKSKQVLNALNMAIARAEKKRGEGGVDVRGCIYERITRPFLRAFDRYLVPTWGDGKAVTVEPYASDPFGRKLGLVELELDKFPTASDLASPGVASLFRSGAMSKNRVKALYQRFVRGPVFRAWWKEARAAAERECSVLHRTDVIEACVRGIGVVSTPIVEDEVGDAGVVDGMADFCLRVKEELREADVEDSQLRGKICSFLDSLARTLPEEVRVSMGLLAA